ncbi:MAG: hypothetical protein COA53_01460 [Rhodobacteraceae bacterium]|nr:MAG: hypothetical protein COA53_01460 [Paracoccaceae bacterium]
MTRVIIHPGFHKTGTTSLQRFLEINATALAPYVRVILKPQMEDVASCARNCSNVSHFGMHTVRRAAFRRRFADLLQRTPLKSGQTLLISCEALVGRMPGRKNVVAFDAAPALAKDIVRVAGKHFGDLDLTLLYTTREQASWMRSAYSHLLHQSKFTMSEEAFAKEFYRAGDLDTIISKITKAIAPRTPITSQLEATAPEPFGPASALLPLLDLPADVVAALEPAKHLNQQLDAFEKSKLQDFNAQDMTDTELSQIKRRFLRKRRNRKKRQEND